MCLKIARKEFWRRRLWAYKQAGEDREKKRNNLTEEKVWGVEKNSGEGVIE